MLLSLYSTATQSVDWLVWNGALEPTSNGNGLVSLGDRLRPIFKVAIDERFGLGAPLARRLAA
jgi:hypothetical protein